MRSYVAIVLLASAICFGVSPGTANASESLFQIAPQLRTSRSYIGVALLDVTADRAKSLGLNEERGVEVVRVVDGSPAEKAGFRAGDILLTYNGEPILGAQQMGRLVWETPQNRRVKLQYLRGGKRHETTVITAAQDKSDVDDGSDFRALRDQLPSMNLSVPADIPSPLVVWRNRMLGVDCEPLDSQLAEYFGVSHGILVRYVEKGSVSEKAGIRSGDVLTELGDRALINPRDLSQCIRTQAATRQVQISLVRNHKALTVRANLVSPPEK